MGPRGQTAKYARGAHAIDAISKEPAQIALSIAAGLPIATLQNWLNGHDKIVRTMPNTPALVGQGMTGIFASNLSEVEHGWVENILTAIGQTVWVAQESQIDAITAISGSGPAYVFYMMEHLTQAALDLGFDAATAKTIGASDLRRCGAVGG